MCFWLYAIYTVTREGQDVCKSLTHSHSEQPKQAWQYWKYLLNKNFFLENIWRRNVNQKSNYNPPSNISWNFVLFPIYEWDKCEWDKFSCEVNSTQGYFKLIAVSTEHDNWFLKSSWILPRQGTKQINITYQHDLDQSVTRHDRDSLGPINTPACLLWVAEHSV